MFNFDRSSIYQAAYVLSPFMQLLEDHANKKNTRHRILKTSKPLNLNENAEKLSVPLSVWVDASDARSVAAMCNFFQEY